VKLILTLLLLAFVARGDMGIVRIDDTHVKLIVTNAPSAGFYEFSRDLVSWHPYFLWGTFTNVPEGWLTVSTADGRVFWRYSQWRIETLTSNIVLLKK